MDFVKSEQVSLKASKDHSEKWLQKQLAEHPEILGLGSITLRDAERVQLKGGRLDLMFDDDSAKVRYTVELQLGATDETHIIRTLEYWDNERSRNPHIDHIAVIVAEDITSRFLNVIALFNKSIPIIAIQLNALKVNGALTLHSVKVLDISHTVGWEDDNNAASATDRAYWTKKSTPKSVEFADKVLELIQVSTQDPTLELKYNKYYIGLAHSGVANNFVTMKPRKSGMVIQFKIQRTDDLTKAIEERLEFQSYDVQWGLYNISLSEQDFAKNKEFIASLIRKAAKLSDSLED
jgi:hypothetical protein